MYATCYHEIDGFLELVLAHYTLHGLIHHVARLGAGITGSCVHLRVQLSAVIGRWSLASLVLSLRVGRVFT